MFVSHGHLHLFNRGKKKDRTNSIVTVREALVFYTKSLHESLLDFSGQQFEVMLYFPSELEKLAGS